MHADQQAPAPDFIRAAYPNAHILQLPEWGQFKSAFGWQPVLVTAENAAAQVLFRRLPLGLSIAYLPKGPLGTNWPALWPRIDQLCREKGAIFLQVEPDLFEPLPADFAAQLDAGFTAEAQTIQPRRSILVDLRPEEEAILAAMKQKTRYNIRLAVKHGVQVRESSDVAAFHRLSEVTASRDAFFVHGLEYYQKVYGLFAPLGECVLLEAWHEEKLLAALMLFLRGERAWYFYGASDDSSRNLMPTYLLQWEAMRLARARGCQTYDLWGIPDADESQLEAEFTQRSDGLWGVYRFKRGFGGQVLRSAPAYLKVYKPLLYRAFQFYRARRKAGADAPA